MRTSEILRGILTKNPGVQNFSVARIITSIGTDRFDASLLMFSIPALIPVPAPKGIVAAPASVIASQMLAGEKRITLPRGVLRKLVSRRALAVAIHAALPVIEAAERVMKPRWGWLSHPYARRAIGFLLFLLAIAIAYPLSGFSVLHGLSIFVVSLGMAEQDGLVMLIGIVAGVVSLAILAASGVTAKAFRSKVVRAVRKLAAKLGRRTLTEFLEERGYVHLAAALSFSWSDLLLVWDPEADQQTSRRDGFEPSATLLDVSYQAVEIPGMPGVDQSSACVG